MDERPMLAIPSTGSSGRRAIRLEDLIGRGWILDTKLDGVRAWWRYRQLINREGVDISHRYPEISLPADHWLDGEIVALDGTFETTLLRDKQSNPATIKRMAEQHPCRFVAFDILDNVAGPRVDEYATYNHRRALLETLSTDVAITPVGTTFDFYEHIVRLKMEGVIAKRPGSGYQFGRRSKDWVKFKVLHRVSMIAIGYEPGNGHRARFGAMTLALIGPNGPVTGPEKGWRVGSGFTERDIRELKARLDAGEMFVVEIECTNRTTDGALRFPVYRGIRSDVAIHDCLTDQIDALPTC